MTTLLYILAACIAVPAIGDALARLDQVWDRYFQYAPAAE